jgi:hypothetical protein
MIERGFSRAIRADQSEIKMTIVSAAFTLLMASRRFPGRRQVHQAVPENALDLAEQEFGRSLQSKDLHFVGAKGRNAHLRHPNRQIGDRAHFLKFFGPVVDLPMVPIQGKAVHGDGIEVLEQAVAFQERKESGINRRYPAQNDRQPGTELTNGRRGEAAHFRKLEPLWVHLKVPVGQVVRLVPQFDGFDHSLFLRSG